MNVSGMKRIETALAALLSLAVLVLLIARATHAGALWRDECAAVQLAQMPAFADVARNFQHEAFPLLFPAVVRVFTDIFGANDGALRCFGLIVGLLLIAVAWFNARAVEPGVPLLSLVLVGLNPGFLTWGTSVRGYGLASVLIVLALGLTARALRKATPLTLTMTLLVSAASVQCLLQNVGLLFAISGSAALVCFSRRELKRSAVFLAIGLISVLLLVPCLASYLGSGSWNMLVKANPDLGTIWQQFQIALGKPVWLMAFLWSLIAALSFSAAIWRLYTLRKTRPAPEWDLVFFLAVLLPASLAAYFLFLRALSYVPQPWYYVALISLLGAGFDLLTIALSRFNGVRIGRIAIAGAALFVLPMVNWPKVIERQTNIDIVARKLE